MESTRHGGDLEHVCHKHLHAMARHFGLQVKKLKTNDLRSRLRMIWGGRSDLIKFKTDHATWFRLTSRPEVPDDYHGVYSQRQIRMNIEPRPTTDQKKMIVSEIAGPGAWDEWHETGNLIAPKMFSWLWDGVDCADGHEEGIGQEIQEEFDMYLHHQAERTGQSNKGWLRTMFFSLTQQIIRQDVGYWLLYACLRPDGNIRLVSYPYYAKYVRPGDYTFFRHIDMNVSMYVEDGHGGNIIQGSVSLDDEDEGGCTEIVPGFHRNIKSWLEKVEGRGHAPNGHVTGLAKTWTKEDGAGFGDFVPVPCCRGAARVTMPEIPHGSTHNRSKNIRKTVLPWFVGVGDDGVSVDNEESDQWIDIAKSHLTQEAPSLTPSGLGNRYGAIPYRFPPATQLNLQRPISNAIVCKTTWRDPMVLAQANTLMGHDRSRALKVIAEHRYMALKCFKAAFRGVKLAEQLFYGERGYFAGRG